MNLLFGSSLSRLPAKPRLVNPFGNKLFWIVAFVINNMFGSSFFDCFRRGC